MAQDRHENPVHFNAAVTFSPNTLTLPAGVVADAQVAAGAAIAHTKLEHQRSPVVSWDGTTPTTTRVLFVARSAGTVLTFRVGHAVACIGAATVTFDLKKNGVTVLTGVVTQSSADAAYTPESGSLSGTPTFVAGDVFTVVTVATAGGGTIGTGGYAEMRVSEAA